MRHWCEPLIGVPYSDDGEGPNAFNCWGLVRFCLRHFHGLDVPRIAGVPEGLDLRGRVQHEVDRVSELRRAVATDWQQVEKPQAGDIMAMVGIKRDLHVGLLIHPGRLLLLHASSTARRVVAQPLSDVRFDGYRQFEFWRHA